MGYVPHKPGTAGAPGRVSPPETVTFAPLALARLELIMNRFSSQSSSPSQSPSPSVGEETSPTGALDRQSLMLELTPVLVCDPRDKIAYWNRAAEVMYGFTREQAVGRLSHELLQTSFPEPLERILTRLCSGRQWQGELLQIRSDGRQIAVASEWIAQLDHEGALEGIIEINTEITKRKQAEEALANTTTRLDGIINSAMDAIISVDESQHILLFNPAAEKMFGVSSSEALGESLDRFIPERFRQAHARDVERFSDTGVSTRRMGSLGSISGLRSSGEEFPIEASISQVEVGGEKLFTVILRDITRRQRAEQGLRQAQVSLEAYAQNLEKTVADRTVQLRNSLDELQAFSYSLSHDMRAPLRAINTFTRIFLDDYGKDLNPDGAELLNKVLAASARMDRLMQDVLAFSRVSRQDLPLQRVDVEKLIIDILLERPEFQTPKAEISIEGPLPPMMGNAACLTQCLTNLLGNAVKFVPPGVRPRVRIRAEERPGMERETRDEEGLAARARPSAPPTVRLWIEDNGIGIEPEFHEKIFDLFQRLHNEFEGTGIGLAIVHKAVERMGGAVGVESEPGKGSRFWFELPRARGQGG